MIAEVGPRPPGERVFFVTGVLLVVLQRVGFAAGDGSVPLGAVVVLAVVVWSLVTGRMLVSPGRLLLLMLLVALGAISLVLSGGDGSLASLLQFAALWLAAVVAAPDGRTGSGAALIAGAAAATLVAAALGIVQTVVDALTGVYLDPIAQLPSWLLVPGYATTQTISSDVFGGWQKANGGMFLEPSFLSLFCALMIVAVLERVVGARWRGTVRLGAVALLVGGLVSSVAISGLVLAPVVLLSLLRRPRALLAGAVLAGAAAAFLATLPVVQAFVDRVLSPGSNEARLIRPYTQLLPQGLEVSPFIGLGPGSADVATTAMTTSWLDEVTAPTVVKLTYEYGLIGLVLGLALLAALALGSALPWRLRLALLVALLVPTNGLASGLIAPLVLLSLAASTTPMIAGSGAVRRSEAAATRDPVASRSVPPSAAVPPS